MNRNQGNTLRKAFSITIPVLMGYTAIGLAFGLLVIHSGFPWYLAPLTGIIIFAGAMQFLTLGILNPLVTFPELAVITFFVNARHSVYGLSMLDRYNASGRYKPYLIYTLTDETYGLLTSTLPPDGVDIPRFYFYVSILNQSYWVTASTIGALIGSAIRIDTTGLDFALTALFIVLAFEQIKRVSSFVPVYIAAACGIGALLLTGPENMLILAILFSIGILLLFRKRLSS